MVHGVLLGPGKIFLHLDLLLDLGDLLPDMSHSVALYLLTHLKGTFGCLRLPNFQHVGDSDLCLGPVQRLEAFTDCHA